jgi:hypothetical protein
LVGPQKVEGAAGQAAGRLKPAEQVLSVSTELGSSDPALSPLREEKPARLAIFGAERLAHRSKAVEKEGSE